MTAVYIKYINTLISAGVVSLQFPMMHFASCGPFSKYGSWGAIEYTGQPIATAPKFLALRQFFNNGSNQLAVTPQISANTSLFGFGVGDFSYMGYPAVISPRVGDTWFAGSGKPVTVQWDPTGTSAEAKVSLHLWKRAYTTPVATTTLVKSIGTNILQASGSFSFTLPSLGFDGTPVYFVEIRGTQSSNFSSFFSIKSSTYFFESATPHCCYGTERLALGRCLRSPSSVQRSAVPVNSNSSWATNSFKCAKALPNFAFRSCGVYPTGCREYRTTAHFKPVLGK